MKKFFWIILVIFLAALSAIFLLRLLSGDEDTWLCTENGWVRHGNPSASMPTTGCQSFTSLSLSMKITSDFNHNEMMPAQYSCDGEWMFPALTVNDIPADAKVLVLIVDDPDAPAGTRDHLLLANIPVEGTNQVISQDTFDIAVFGKNSRGTLARWAPCPPSGTHRYFFKIYALAEKLEIPAGFPKKELLDIMWGKIVDQAELIGLYKRQ